MAYSEQTMTRQEAPGRNGRRKASAPETSARRGNRATSRREQVSGAQPSLVGRGGAAADAFLVPVYVEPWSVTRVLLFVVGFLIVACLTFQFADHVLGTGRLYGLVPGFDMDAEANFPAWYSTILLQSAAVLFGLIAAGEQRVRSRWTWHWWGLAAAFTYMSVDELAGLHELTIKPLRSLWGTEGIFHYAWVIPWFVLVVVFTVAYVRFWLKLPRPTRWLMGIAWTVYVSGALGMELIGSSYAHAHGVHNMRYALITTVEESMEMFGAIMMIHALLRHLGTSQGQRVDEAASGRR